MAAPEVPSHVAPEEVGAARAALEEMFAGAPPPPCGVATCLICRARERPGDLVPLLQDVVNEVTHAAVAATRISDPTGRATEGEAEGEGEKEAEAEDDPTPRRVRPRGPSAEEIIDAGGRVVALLDAGSALAVHWTLFYLAAMVPTSFRKLVAAGACRGGAAPAAHHATQLYMQFMHVAVLDATRLSVDETTAATVLGMLCADLFAAYGPPPRAATRCAAHRAEPPEAAACAACAAADAATGSSCLAYVLTSPMAPDVPSATADGLPWPMTAADAARGSGVPRAGPYTPPELDAFANRADDRGATAMVYA